jgi:hypothetical protein
MADGLSPKRAGSAVQKRRAGQFNRWARFSCRSAAGVAMSNHRCSLELWPTAITCAIPMLARAADGPEIKRIPAGCQTDALSPKRSRLTLELRLLNLHAFRLKMAATMSESLVRPGARPTLEQDGTAPIPRLCRWM